jgi:hypothetical protein
MAGEDNWDTYVLNLFQTNWMGVVTACLSPLTPEDVDQGLQLIRIVPLDERTSFQQRLRSAVNKQFQEHSTGIQRTVNITGNVTSPQKTYAGDLNTIIDAESRRNVRELFAWYLKRASYIYRRNGEEEKRTNAEHLVVTIINL